MLPLRYARTWLATGILILGIGLVLALAPGPGSLPSLNDKVVHIAGFMAFMVWFGGIFSSRTMPLIALALAGYGLLIEVLQAFTPTRQAEGLDLGADVLGILLGWLASSAGLSRWCATLESWLARPNP